METCEIKNIDCLSNINLHEFDAHIDAPVGFFDYYIYEQVIDRIKRNGGRELAIQLEHVDTVEKFGLMYNLLTGKQI